MLVDFPSEEIEHSKITLRSRAFKIENWDPSFGKKSSFAFIDPETDLDHFLSVDFMQNHFLLDEIGPDWV